MALPHHRLPLRHGQGLGYRPLAWTALLALGVAAQALAQDLGLALQAAQERDPTLASARANREAAAENVEIARARLRPQLNLQSTSQHLAQSTQTVLGENQFNGRSGNTQLTLRQGLLRPRDLIGLEAGQIQADYGAAKYRAAQSDLWLRTSQAWIDALATQAQQRLCAQVIAPLEQAATQEARRLSLGDGTRDASAEARAQLALARAQLAEAQLNAQTSRAALRDLTGLTLDGLSDLTLPDPLQVPQPGGVSAHPAPLLAQVLAHNPELQAADLNRQGVSRRLDQTQADHFPTLDLIGSAATAKSDASSTLNTRYHNHQLGFQFSMPLYTGGGISANARQALASLNAAAADQEALAQKLQLQFQSDYNTQLALRERLLAARELVRAAEENRRAAELGLKAGLKTWGDLGNAHSALARRQSDALALQATLLKTQARLLSLLPVEDTAWADWTAAVSQLAQGPQPGRPR